MCCCVFRSLGWNDVTSIDALCHHKGNIIIISCRTKCNKYLRNPSTVVKYNYRMRVSCNVATESLHSTALLSKFLLFHVRRFMLRCILGVHHTSLVYYTFRGFMFSSYLWRTLEDYSLILSYPCVFLTQVMIDLFYYYSEVFPSLTWS